MLGRGWGCYAASTALATLALGSYAANQARGESSPLLDALTVTFAGLAVVFLIVGTAILLLWAARWIWCYFHTVEVHPQQWYCRYWPLQRLLQVSGVPITTRDWAGKVSVSCEVQIFDEAMHFLSTISEHSHGSLTIEFPQQSVSLATHPVEGDPAMVRIKAQPSWWRGRSDELMQLVQIGITDHRSQDEIRSDGLRKEVRELIAEARDLQRSSISPDSDPPTKLAENWRIRTNKFLKANFGDHVSDFDAKLLRGKHKLQLTWEVAEAPALQMKLWRSLQAGIEWLEALEAEFSLQ